MEEILMDVPQSVLSVIRTALDLVPNDAVSQYPTLLIGKLQSHPPRDTEELLV
jgi:hypothetical protein